MVISLAKFCTNYMSKNPQYLEKCSHFWLSVREGVSSNEKVFIQLREVRFQILKKQTKKPVNLPAEDFGSTYELTHLSITFH